MMKLKIINAINEGIKRSLIQFDDDPVIKKQTKVVDHTIAMEIFNDWFNEDGTPMPLDLYNTLKLEHISNFYLVDNNIELKKLINRVVLGIGPNASLNWIDVSHITDMSDLFRFSSFDGDISNWDVSNVKNMRYIFWGSHFTGDISNWDFRSCTNFYGMFLFYAGTKDDYDMLMANLNKIDIEKNNINLKAGFEDRYRNVFFISCGNDELYKVKKPKFLLELQKIIKEQNAQKKMSHDQIMKPYFEILSKDKDIAKYYDIRMTKASSIKIDNDETDCTISYSVNNNIWYYKLDSAYRFQKRQNSFYIKKHESFIIKNGLPFRGATFSTFEEMYEALKKDPYFMYFKYDKIRP